MVLKQAANGMLQTGALMPRGVEIPQGVADTLRTVNWQVRAHWRSPPTKVPIAVSVTDLASYLYPASDTPSSSRSKEIPLIDP